MHARQASFRDASSPAEAGADASVQVIVERPSEGLARGNYAWPSWGIGLLGAVVAITAFAYLAWRLWQRRK
jgi:hypothetical protein